MRNHHAVTAAVALRLVIGLAALTGATAAPGPTETGPQTLLPRERIEVALNYVRLGNFNAAMARLERDADAGETSGDELALLAKLYLNAGHAEKAKTTADDALRVEANNPAALEVLGAVALNRTAYADALDLFSQALIGEPTRDEAIYGKARALNALNRSKEALPLLSSIADAHAADPFYFTDRAAAYVNLSQPDAAKADYDKAVALAPRDAYIRLDRARFFHKRVLGQSAAALTDYLAALEILPNHILALEGAGLCYFDLNKYDEAKTYLNKVTDLRPGFTRVDPFLGFIAYVNGEYAAAADYYTRSADRFPDEPSYFLMAAISYTRLKRFDRATAVATAGIAAMRPRSVAGREDRDFTFLKGVADAMAKPNKSLFNPVEYGKAPANLERARYLFYYGEHQRALGAIAVADSINDVALKTILAGHVTTESKMALALRADGNL